MTYEELMALALKHYNEGGDGVYECWDKQTFDEYVAEHGEITHTDALKMFGIWESVCNDIRGY
jgi:hypothetical protein